MVRLVSIWLLVAGTALAQETSPAPVEKSAAPSEDAISAAKRDFNTIKAARGSFEQSPKLDLSSVSAPELQTGGTTPALTPASRPPHASANKSANWLVDAMMKPGEKDLRDPRAKTSELMKRERTDPAVGGQDPRAEDDSPPVTQVSPREKEASVSVIAEKKMGPEFNPLLRYMSGWMTPQDYSLLKPGLDSAAAASPTNRGDPSLAAGGADLSLLGDAGSALDLSAAGKSASFALPKPADNPFLQPVNPSSASAMVAFTAPAAPSSTPASATFVPPVNDVAPARSKIPDFAKPAADEKYFKQLKRF